MNLPAISLTIDKAHYVIVPKYLILIGIVEAVALLLIIASVLIFFDFKNYRRNKRW
jgi:hypothetical protein